MLLHAFRLVLIVHTYAIKQLTATLLVLAIVLPSIAPVTKTAHAQTAKTLYLREIKITGEEFVVLEAVSDISNLGEYWLAYNSSETATNIVPSQQLPAIALSAGKVF